MNDSRYKSEFFDFKRPINHNCLAKNQSIITGGTMELNNDRELVMENKTGHYLDDGSNSQYLIDLIEKINPEYEIKYTDY